MTVVYDDDLTRDSKPRYRSLPVASPELPGKGVAVYATNFVALVRSSFNSAFPKLIHNPETDCIYRCSFYVLLLFYSNLGAP